jgi:dihydropteroate synthase
MGIINCTPDSFYSGSRRLDPREAIESGIRMVEEGADILDIGGESSRPGSDPVSNEEELNRVLPVIEGLLKSVDIPISIDTYKSSVAKAALELGGHIINDISGLGFDTELGSVAAQYDVPVILMHIKGKPKNMQMNPSYDNVVTEIYEYFKERLKFAIGFGIKKEQIVLDPGLGFGKHLRHNYEIVNGLKKFANLRCPILVGPSRKSFIQKVLNLPSEEAKEGSLAMATAAILKGAHIIRVHDVKEMKRAAQIADFLIRTPNTGESV